MVDVDSSLGLEFVSLAESLEELIGKPVDLVSRRAVKPRYWETIKSDLIYV